MVYFFGGSTAARFRKCLWTLDLSTLDFYFIFLNCALPFVYLLIT